MAIIHGLLGSSAGQGGFTPMTATGGDSISSYTYNGDDYKVHKFTGSGTFTISANPMGTTFDVLVQGAGGHGGNGISAVVGQYVFEGGGGAGLRGTKNSLAGTATTYAVVIGAGGSVGGVSSFTHGSDTYTAGGGGQGGYTGTSGHSSYGGYGGGSGGYYHYSVGNSNGGPGTGMAHSTSPAFSSSSIASTGINCNGGDEYGSASDNSGRAGGGGGGSSAGTDGALDNAGDGAAGAQHLEFNHTPYITAGGGGGMMSTGASQGAGGSGVGGDGAAGNAYNTTACNADANSGSGGGGASYAENSWANGSGTGQGGSGIVMVRYRVTA